jgi:secretion/DNA translocation related TadE-like protein
VRSLPHRDAAERGSATVLALGVVGAVLVLLSGGVAVGGAVRAAHQAQASADLASLAAAVALQQGAAPEAACRQAAAIAGANGADVRACSPAADESISVRVSVDLPDPLGVLPGPAIATARAGPAVVRRS